GSRPASCVPTWTPPCRCRRSPRRIKSSSVSTCAERSSCRCPSECEALSRTGGKRRMAGRGPGEGGGVAKGTERELLSVAGREVAVTHPHKVLFPEAGYTKLGLVHYYLAVAEGALRGAGGRPNVLVRYPNGIDAEFFYQKRAPRARPDWI